MGYGNCTTATHHQELLLLLASHYRLIELIPLEEASQAGFEPTSLFDELVSSGRIDRADVAFLERKAERLLHPEHAGGGFLEIAQELGYLSAEQAAELARIAPVAPPAGDYRLALWAHALEQLDLRQVVDVLEQAGRPLLFCADCRIAYHPHDGAAVTGTRLCPECEQPLQAMTNLPEQGLAAPPLPILQQLQLQPLPDDPAVEQGHHVLLVARRYHLIDHRQAAQLAHRAPESVEGMARLLLEQGCLTTAEFRFLRGRAASTLSTGRGTTGGDAQRPLVELADWLGYLSPPAIELLRELELLQELACVQLLYNLGHLRFWQALDLLERKGLLLHHCRVCRVQRPAEGSAPAECPVCAAPMIALAGWQTPEELALPIPGLPHLSIQGDAEPEQAEQPAPPPAPAETDAEQVEAATRELIERYELIEEPRLDLPLFEEVCRSARRSGTPLLELLDRTDCLPRPAVAFLRRRLDPRREPAASGADLLELGTRRGYLPRGIVPGLTGELLPSQSFRLIESAYNTGVLRRYQLADLLESTGQTLGHCPGCRVQRCELPATACACPDCGGKLERFPNGLPLATLAEIDRLSIKPYRRPRPGSPAHPAPVDAPHCRPAETDRAIEQSIRRYGFIGDEELELALECFREGAGGEVDLEEYLFENGLLTAAQLEFLGQQRQRADHTPAGPQGTLLEAALARNYLSLLRAHKLLRQPGAPDPLVAPDLELGCYLYEHGALQLFQMIDLLDERDVALAWCPGCCTQFHLIGRTELLKNRLCPTCDKRLAPLTCAAANGTPPGPLPTFERLAFRTYKARRLTRRSPVPTPGRKPEPDVPALVQITLDPPAPRRKPLPEAPKPAARRILPDPPAPPPSQAEWRQRVRRRRAVEQACRTQTPPARRPGESAEMSLVSQGVRRLTWTAGLTGLALVGLLAAALLRGGQRQPRPETAVAPTPPAPGTRLLIYGQANPRSVSWDASPPCFLLAVDLDRHYWVECGSDETRRQLRRLTDYLEQYGDKQPLYLQVEGTLRRSAEGADQTPSGKTAYCLSAIRLRRVASLPSERVQR